MPKRTNDFQKLVALIQHAFLPENAVIVESDIVSELGHAREVDVAIRAPAGDVSLKVAIEAKDEKRKVTVQRIDEYFGKYRSGTELHADKVVIVSKSGFTRSARDKGRHVSFELLTLKEAVEVDWKHLVHPRCNHLFYYSDGPQLHSITIVPPVPDGTRMNDLRVKCRSCGGSCGTPLDYANSVAGPKLRDERFMHQLTTQMRMRGGAAAAHFKIAGNTVELYHNDVLMPLTEIVATFHMLSEKSPLNISTYEQTSLDNSKQVIQRATANFRGATLDFIVPDWNKPEQMVARLEGKSTVYVRNGLRRKNP